MKTSFLSIRTSSFLVVLLLTLMALSINAQNTQRGFSFQGFARDFDGAAYSSSNITAQFTISPVGEATVAYTEVQSLTTDAYGVFNAIVGSVAAVDFSEVDFSAKNYKMKVEVRVTGGDYVTISDSELLAVPYAKAADKASNADNATSADNAISADNGVPPGIILPFGGPIANVPTGYLVCDGTSVLRADYPELFAAIGTAWGTLGASEFNLPDLRGRFARGLDNGAGIDPDAAGRVAAPGGNAGDAVGSYQWQEIQSHAHVVKEGGTGGGGGQASLWATAYQGEVVSGPAGGNETRPKNAYVLYIIKY